MTSRDPRVAAAELACEAYEDDDESPGASGTFDDRPWVYLTDRTPAHACVEGAARCLASDRRRQLARIDLAGLGLTLVGFASYPPGDPDFDYAIAVVCEVQRGMNLAGAANALLDAWVRRVG